MTETTTPAPPTLTCFCCGHTDKVPHDPAQSLYTCDQCGARTAFGVPMARTTVDAHEDRRFIALKFAWGPRGDTEGGITLALDREYAAGIAFEILSVCDPVRWQALQMLAARARDVGARHVAPAPESARPAPPPEDDVALLDEVNAPPPGFCQCGKPSVLKNGACLDCTQAAIGG